LRKKKEIEGNRGESFVCLYRSAIYIYNIRKCVKGKKEIPSGSVMAGVMRWVPSRVFNNPIRNPTYLNKIIDPMFTITA
jgi:hypothetical protein